MRSAFFVPTANLFAVAIVATLAASSSFSQDEPRSAQAIEAERSARELFSAEDYDKAVPILERATSVVPLDLKDLSLLGMAYLYSSSRLDLVANLPRAQATMDKVIEDGGEAVFLVGRGDDPIKSMAIHMVKVIQGELRIRKTSLQFVPTRTTAGLVGPLSGADIKECGLNRSYGKDSNAFHLKVLKDTVNFRPLHFSKDESNLVCTLAAKYLGTKIVN
jgi:hypothetical protein